MSYKLGRVCRTWTGLAGSTIGCGLILLLAKASICKWDWCSRRYAAQSVGGTVTALCCFASSDEPQRAAVAAVAVWVRVLSIAGIRWSWMGRRL